jgi:hypothetical protein
MDFFEIGRLLESELVRDYLKRNKEDTTTKILGKSRKRVAKDGVRHNPETTSPRMEAILIWSQLSKKKCPPLRVWRPF